MHIAHPLERIDTLVRAQVRRFRAAISDTKPDGLWSMTLVSHGEVHRYLHSPFQPPGSGLPETGEPTGTPDPVAGEAKGTEPRAPEHGVRTQTLDRLVERFGLSPLERDVLLVCLLAELDSRYRRLYAYLLDDNARYQPDVDLVLEILRPEIVATGDDPVAARRIFSPSAPLLRWQLIHLERGERPLAYRGVRLDDRLAAHLLGDSTPDGRLRPFLLREPEHGPAPDDAELGTWLRHLLTEGARDPQVAPLLYLRGRDGSGRRALARRAAGEAGLALLVFDTGRAAADPTAWAGRLMLARREALLAGAAVVWWAVDGLRDGPPQAATPGVVDPWEQLLTSLAEPTGPVFLAGTLPWEPARRIRGRPVARIDLPTPDLEHRRALWRQSLPASHELAGEDDEREALAEALAATFQLTGGQVVDAVATARAQALRRAGAAGTGEPVEPTAEELYNACRRLTAGELATVARRVEPPLELGFDDLILPLSQKRQVDELRARIRHRRRVLFDLGFERRLAIGRGLVALFTGPSGTGKTLAAQLLAREQGVDLYQVDLATVVSKWVGETEKNLGRLFDQAEDTDAVLLFDEADALFGRRGEVSDARDRWANLETNYLLQRVEAYPGVVVLTTNLRQNLDPAFLRRIQAIIDFPMPDEEQRFDLWRVLFPTNLARPDDPVLRSLAERFPLTGGEIKNAVLDATFRAVAEQTNGAPPTVTERHLLAAIARSLQKEGKLLRRSDFGEEMFEWLDREVL